ncbi:MAG: hypothetical protein VKN72_08495 [Nostocales cyanobacterium 94392]|jgi:hypothetical protein|uniref:Uncharacterized protein n=2 Tax=Sphaerospermopsis TaxID=752201 RepID=A0A480A0H5_9CYAN|nr:MULTISPECIES: hypothetical protein [Sphaerospermopsis]MEB3216257.1 hypothetical protein [Nostocales cyanobacterium 94392]MBC5797420.1 hypothetical protein [Sphaerospermopsis sp. LEGE 00249]MBD2132389.1 hypothetical protein [Sphaerospermopsis sp. FACHB-1094]MBD2145220.1 hypothetical protein [Sphaerospermopsis sp. FACHB-1194]MBE9235197.1 hypothetical protein [Sphaerospermopsis aphanizomenoides LEGE 00250]
MITGIKQKATVGKNGKIELPTTELPEGTIVEVIVLSSPLSVKKKILTARELLDSSLIGLWEKRDDIPDSLVYARQLREQSQRRDYDSPR